MSNQLDKDRNNLAALLHSCSSRASVKTADNIWMMIEPCCGFALNFNLIDMYYDLNRIPSTVVEKFLGRLGKLHLLYNSDQHFSFVLLRHFYWLDFHHQTEKATFFNSHSCFQRFLWLSSRNNGIDGVSNVKRPQLLKVYYLCGSSPYLRVGTLLQRLHYAHSFQFPILCDGTALTVSHFLHS